MRAFVLLLIFTLTTYYCNAIANISKYGINSSSEIFSIDSNATAVADSQTKKLSMFDGYIIWNDMELHHSIHFSTADFYSILLLCLLLGIIRVADVSYFGNLWKAFFNTGYANAQLKDQVDDAGFPNFLMNMFFIFSFGLYLYYITQFFPIHTSSVLLMALLVFLVGMIYATKFVLIRTFGWILNINELTNEYLFNVFLTNKIAGILLVPVIVVEAFAAHNWAKHVVVFSIILMILLYIARYLRSGQFFSTFFRYSKFHFILYLCAIELLPLAVLAKLFIIRFM
jgi:Domain of unknown function (DUF4271)